MLAMLTAGAFMMQFMVRGAWGIVPAHLAELSPPQVRASSRPRVSVGVFFASFAALARDPGEYFGYTRMAGTAAVVTVWRQRNP